MVRPDVVALVLLSGLGVVVTVDGVVAGLTEVEVAAAVVAVAIAVVVVVAAGVVAAGAFDEIVVVELDKRRSDTRVLLIGL